MSWYASGYGEITAVSGGIPGNILSELEKMCEFDLHQRAGSRWIITYDGNFHSDSVEDYLGKIAPYVESGFIEMSGEEDTYWKYVIRDGAWGEVSGRIAYDDELGRVCAINSSNESKLAFLHDLIDVFEDFLNDRGIVIENPDKAESGDGAANIYGTDYGDLESELECILQGWHVLK